MGVEVASVSLLGQLTVGVSSQETEVTSTPTKPVEKSTVNCPSQETEVASTPTGPVENFVITTKGLQDRNNLLLDGSTVENKGKVMLISRPKVRGSIPG